MLVVRSAQESIDFIDELQQEVRAAHNKVHWETVAAKPLHKDPYLEEHRLCLSMEKDPSLSSPVYSLRSDSPHQ